MQAYVSVPCLAFSHVFLSLTITQVMVFARLLSTVVPALLLLFVSSMSNPTTHMQTGAPDWAAAPGHWVTRGHLDHRSPDSPAQPLMLEETDPNPTIISYGLFWPASALSGPSTSSAWPSQWWCVCVCVLVCSWGGMSGYSFCRVRRDCDFTCVCKNRATRKVTFLPLESKLKTFLMAKKPYLA